jgi:predicted dehydrogenase
VKKSDRVVQIGTQIRSLPASFGARQFIKDGRLGKIFKVEQSRNASTAPGWDIAIFHKDRTPS